MIRISNQEMTFPHRIFNRIHKMQERAEKRNCHQKKNGEPSGSGPTPPLNSPRGGHRFHGFPGMRGCGRMGGMRGGCGGRAWAIPAFEAMMKEWMGEQEIGNKENKESKENMEDKENRTKHSEATMIAGSSEYLEDVGNFVAA